MLQLKKSDLGQPQTISTSPHIVDTNSDVLHKATDQNVNLALWQRSDNQEIKREVSALQADDLPDMRRRTTLNMFDDDVCSFLRQQGLDPQHFKYLRTDLLSLAEILSDVCQCREFVYRLVTIAGNECSRFHMDTTALRLICTYRGPGTEWLSNWQVDREALARCSSNVAIAGSGEPSKFERFWVGVMKGDPGNHGLGFVHRSPSVEESNEIRVLFCLDPDFFD